MASCPRTVLLQNARGELLPAPCRTRLCPYCGPHIYLPRHRARILRGVLPFAGMRHAVKEMTFTAPGDDGLRAMFPGVSIPDAIEAWNAREPRRWRKLWELLREGGLYGDLPYVGVRELQERGAIHVHVLVISTHFMDMEFVRSCAVRAGYGPRIQLQSTDRRLRSGVRGAVKYLTKYITKCLGERGRRNPVVYSRDWSQFVRVARAVSGVWALASRELREWWRYSGAQWLYARGEVVDPERRSPGGLFDQRLT